MSKETSPAPVCVVRLPIGAAIVLALLRIGIGWHFLHEGVVKLLDRGWTAAEYLRSSVGPLAPYFHRLAENPMWLKCADSLNIIGLIALGLALMLGLLTRTAAFLGIVLLGLYYLAYPPLAGLPATGLEEGNYLLLNKNLVELLALLVVLVIPGSKYGLDGLLAAWRARAQAEADPDDPKPRPNEIVMSLAPPDFSRRRMLAGLAGVPFIGGYVLALMKQRGWLSHEERVLTTRARVDARSGATLKFDFSKTLADLKGKPPMARIGNVELSRMMLGGNLIGGWAHARDLIYVSKLVKAYHHPAKVYETFRLAEACGINAIITNPVLCGIINDYWRDTGGKIKFISDCGGDNVLEGAKQSIDKGACACYVHGGVADTLVAQGKFDMIAQTLELIRKNGLPAGIAGHKLKTVMGCVEVGIQPDFWMKTLHQRNYPTAQLPPECDSNWCDDPDGTIAFMATQKQPWIAYKILAAGALQPRENFRYAFAGGADFICVGMYDFQIIEDVNHAVEVLAEKDKLPRQRAWCV